MALDTKTVGSNERQITILGDPTTASKYASVLALADATSLAGLYASLAQNVPLLLNAAGTFDQLRSAKGTTGVLATNSEGTKATYSAGIVGFTPAATATDFAVVIGSGTKTVRLLRVSISGFASSAATVSIQLIKRTTDNTGGTRADIGTPVAGLHDSNDGALTASVKTYSANPSGLGTAGGVIRAAKLNLGATGSAGSFVWDFSNRNSEALVLRGATQIIALNWNGAAVPGGTTLDFDFEFSEE